MHLMNKGEFILLTEMPHSRCPYKIGALHIYSAPVRVQVLWSTRLSVCVYVCLSVCPRAYLWNRSANLYEIVCADPRSILLAALRYVMYFRFYGWRQVWSQWAWRRNVATAPYSNCHERRGDTAAESDVYECLVCIWIRYIRCHTNYTT